MAGIKATLVSSFKGMNSKVCSLIAESTQKCDPDAVLIMSKGTTDLKGDINFDHRLSLKEVDAVETHLVSTGSEGLTWHSNSSGHTLSIATVPELGNTSRGTLKYLKTVSRYAESVGWKTSVNKSYMKAFVMNPSNYDSFIKK